MEPALDCTKELVFNEEWCLVGLCAKAIPYQVPTPVLYAAQCIHVGCHSVMWNVAFREPGLGVIAAEL